MDCASLDNGVGHSMDWADTRSIERISCFLTFCLLGRPTVVGGFSCGARYFHLGTRDQGLRDLSSAVSRGSGDGIPQKLKQSTDIVYRI